MKRTVPCVVLFLAALPAHADAHEGDHAAGTGYCSERPSEHQCEIYRLAVAKGGTCTSDLQGGEFLRLRASLNCEAHVGVSDKGEHECNCALYGGKLALLKTPPETPVDPKNPPQVPPIPQHYLLLPTDDVRGIEEGMLYDEPKSRDYWSTAWDLASQLLPQLPSDGAAQGPASRIFSEPHSAEALAPGRDAGPQARVPQSGPQGPRSQDPAPGTILAVNGVPRRSMNQLHIHIAQLQPALRRVLESLQPRTDRGAPFHCGKKPSWKKLPDAARYTAFLLPDDKLSGKSDPLRFVDSLRPAHCSREERAIAVTAAPDGKGRLLLLGCESGSGAHPEYLLSPEYAAQCHAGEAP